MAAYTNVAATWGIVFMTRQATSAHHAGCAKSLFDQPWPHKRQYRECALWPVLKFQQFDQAVNWPPKVGRQPSGVSSPAALGEFKKAAHTPYDLLVNVSALRGDFLFLSSW